MTKANHHKNNILTSLVFNTFKSLLPFSQLTQEQFSIRLKLFFLNLQRIDLKLVEPLQKVDSVSMSSMGTRSVKTVSYRLSFIFHPNFSGSVMNDTASSPVWKTLLTKWLFLILKSSAACEGRSISNRTYNFMYNCQWIIKKKEIINTSSSILF